LQLKRQQLSERDARARVDRDAGAASAERVTALSAAIDLAQANLRYGSGDSTDLPALRERLAEAQREHSRIEGIARAAAIASSRYSSEIAALGAQSKQLSAKTPELLRAALLEVMAERRPRYERAVQELRSALCSTLEAASAIDVLSAQLGQSPVGAAALFADLTVPNPFADGRIITDTVGQLEHGKQLAIEHEQHAQTWRDTVKRGEQLANQLLAGEASAP